MIGRVKEQGLLNEVCENNNSNLVVIKSHSIVI